MATGALWAMTALTAYSISESDKARREAKTEGDIQKKQRAAAQKKIEQRQAAMDVDIKKKEEEQKVAKETETLKLKEKAGREKTASRQTARRKASGYGKSVLTSGIDLDAPATKRATLGVG